LYKYVHSSKPDILFTGGDALNIMCILAAIGTKTKVIISQHNYYDIEASKQGLWSRFLHPIMRCVYPMANKIIAVSNGIANYLINSVGIPEGKVEVLYNPVDIADIEKRSNESAQTESFGDYILFVGRISPVKNLPFLIDAFDKADIGDVNLVLVGDGSETESLKSKCSNIKKSNKVFFTGIKENPLPYIKKCKALILCSLSESFGCVLVEALALNKPVVSTPTAGAKEILEYRQGTYILNSFHDVDEFASNIEKAVKFDGGNLSSYVSKFRSEIIIEHLLQMIEKW
jgi:glycosyltransferase involved in cell wall biosynthesis